MESFKLIKGKVELTFDRKKLYWQKFRHQIRELLKGEFSIISK